MDAFAPRVTRRGLTLAEVLVASAIFAMLTVMTLAAYRLSFQASAKQDVHSQAYRAAMLGVGHIQRLLRGSELVAPKVGDPAATELEFQPPLKNDELLEVDQWGAPRWGASQKIRLEGTNLVHEDDAGRTRLLARLGERGEASFNQPTQGMVEIRLTSDAAGSLYEVTFKVFLANQQSPPVTRF
ncbi:MAG: type II secretion system protein J [Vulcanimicrobiota bacterium]